ncbi:MAG: 4Fe-4S binding protein, partial [Chloroflexi bacterium]|nr:4Fe-4S binding protein [Chloroflexota bacterium]
MATVKTPRMAFRQVIRLLLLFLMVLWFPVLMNYMSVFLIIEGSARGILTFSFFFWLAWVLFALVLGRAGCGWTCPLGAFQETGDRMVPKDLVKVKRLRVIKYFFAVGWVGAIVAAISSTGGTGNINLLYKTESGISATTVENWLTWGSIVLVVLMPTFFMGRRAFCHYFCPWGVLNIEMTSVRNRLHLPGLRLKGDPQKC